MGLYEKKNSRYEDRARNSKRKKNTKVEGERRMNRVQYRDPRAASREGCALQAGSGADCEARAVAEVEDVVGRVLLRPKRDVAGRVLLGPKRDVAGQVLLGPKRDGAGRVAEAEESGAGQVAEADRERRERSRSSCWLKEVEAKRGAAEAVVEKSSRPIERVDVAEDS